MRADDHLLCGAYVLDAVEPGERELFERHLRGCESCRDEVVSLRHATSGLGQSLAVPVPSGMKVKVLDEVARTPQLTPIDHRRSRLLSSRRVGTFLAAAAAAVVFFGAGVVVQNLRAPDVDGMTAAQVFEAPDARVHDMPVGQGMMRVAASDAMGVMAVDCADLPAPPTGMVYQLWHLKDGEATSLDVMDPATSAVEGIPMVGTLAVTVEPDGGSPAPTSEPMLSMDLAEI